MARKLSRLYIYNYVIIQFKVAGGAQSVEVSQVRTKTFRITLTLPSVWLLLRDNLKVAGSSPAFGSSYPEINQYLDQRQNQAHYDLLFSSLAISQ